jgi:PH domain
MCYHLTSAFGLLFKPLAKGADDALAFQSPSPLLISTKLDVERDSVSSIGSNDKKGISSPTIGPNEKKGISSPTVSRKVDSPSTMSPHYPKRMPNAGKATTMTMIDVSAPKTTLEVPGKLERKASQVNAESPMGRLSATGKHRADSRHELSGYVEIIQQAHYNSSKHTIRGTYFVSEPGTFALVFDNSFSMKTPKKLFFFVGLKEVDPSQVIRRRELQGWMLKKGNRAMQGWQKRWVELEASGVLSYFRSPKNTNHGSVNLRDCAVRADHDTLLLDIGNFTLTFRLWEILISLQAREH